MLYKLTGKARGILSVDESASKQDIQSVYRRLARQYHPDKCASREMFELIHVCKEILLWNIEQQEQATSDTSIFQVLRNVVTQFVHAHPAPKVPQIELPTDFLETPD